MTTITEPGVYDIPADLYHADPIPGGSLSHSGAKTILKAPALFKWEREHGRPNKTAYDEGHAAHKLVLGAGPEIVELDFPDWRTKAAREARDAAYAAGQVPMLVHELEPIKAMAAALRAHPLASELFAAGSGKPEQSLFWRDNPTGIWRRALVDWLREPLGSARLLIPDYKSTKDASPAACERAIFDYGYYQQADWYSDGVLSLDLAEEVAFLLVFQEKRPPYLVNVVQLDATFLRMGRERNRRAIAKYIECTTTDTWPGYGDEVHVLTPPRWAEVRHEEEQLSA